MQEQEDDILPVTSSTEKNFLVEKQISIYWAEGMEITCSTILNALPPPGVTPDYEWLIAHGMKHFDACQWLDIPTDLRPELELAADIESVDIPSRIKVTLAIFYCYIHLLVKAKYPDDPICTDLSYLSVTMELNRAASIYIDVVCSFDVRTVSPEWIRHIRFSWFTLDTLREFKLIVAGYKLFIPFSMFQCDEEETDSDVIAAYEVARKIACSPPSWNIHPLFRPVKILDGLVDLERCLMDLMVHCFTEDEMSELIDKGFLSDENPFEVMLTGGIVQRWRAWPKGASFVTHNLIF